MKNIFYKPNEAIEIKTFQNGLSSYTQKNCQVTLTDNGYRIYRPPNLTTSANGKTMWGGLKIINSSGSNTHLYDSSKDNFFGLIKGHSYIIRFHVTGQSHNTFDTFYWGNQMGWSGGGLTPNPSDIKSHKIPIDFNGEDECYYQFTINDDIVKTCTTTYSYATAGNQYLSYNHFCVGFEYSSTGELGTDLYITNLRMYDVTDNEKNYSITKEGIILPAQVIEMPINQVSIQNSGDLICNNFYEY